MARRPRLSAPEPLGAVIIRGDAVRAPVAVDAPPVAARDWELAVGTKIARRARPTKLERGVLHVRTATSTWAQELSLLADTIAAQLRARGLDVRSLRFQVGAVEPLKRPAWRTDVRTSPEPAALPPAVSASLAQVGDTDLRDAIARAAAASLGYESVPAKPAKTRKTPARAPDASRGSPTANDAETAADRDAKRKREVPPPTPPPATSPRSAAPDPRSAGARSARPGRTSPERRAAPRGTRGGP